MNPTREMRTAEERRAAEEWKGRRGTEEMARDSTVVEEGGRKDALTGVKER